MLATISKNWKWLLALIIFSVVARIICLRICGVVTTNDATNYLSFAEQIRSLDFSKYNGIRPPGYPLLLVCCFGNLWTVAAFQSLLGILTSLLLSAITFRQTQSVVWAFCIGLANSLCFNQLVFEHVILTETVARFLVVAALFQFQSISRSARTGALPLLCLGCLVALGFLTRLNLLCLAPVFLLALLLEPTIRRSPSGFYIRFCIPFLLPVFIAWFGLCVFNKFTLNYFAPSTNLGYLLAEHSSHFIDRAPDRFADVRETFLAVMREHRAAPVELPIVDEAAKRLHNRTGIHGVALTQRLSNVSLLLFIRCPGQYARSVWIAWCRFFSPLSVWFTTLCSCRDMFYVGLLHMFWFLQALCLWVCNGLLFAAALWQIRSYWLGYKRKGVSRLSLELVEIAVVLVASIASALVSFYGCARQCVPFQPLIFLAVVHSARLVSTSFQVMSDKRL